MDTQKVENFQAPKVIQFRNSDISLLFRLLEQASITIEQQQHVMRTLKSEQQTFKQLIATLEEQILVEIQKGASLSNQLIETRKHLDGIKPANMPWKVLSLAMKPCRTQSDVDLLSMATADNELKGNNSNKTY